MKRKFGIAAVAALSTIAFSQLASAESYDFWTAATPMRAESKAVSPMAAPVVSVAVGEEFNEFTAVAPNRTDARTVTLHAAPISDARGWEEFNEFTAVAPKRADASQPTPAIQSAVAWVNLNDATHLTRIVDLAPM